MDLGRMITLKFLKAIISPRDIISSAVVLLAPRLSTGISCILERKFIYWFPTVLRWVDPSDCSGPSSYPDQFQQNAYQYTPLLPHVQHFAPNHAGMNNGFGAAYPQGNIGSSYQHGVGWPPYLHNNGTQMSDPSPPMGEGQQEWMVSHVLSLSLSLLLCDYLL